jgi:Tol biopolymer transport system component
VRFLTSEHEVMDYWPCFSPDGHVVLFSRSVDAGKTWSLYTVPVEGGPVRKLEGSFLPASATRPAWSGHDGRIAFTAEEPNGKATVWIREPDGGQPHQVTAAGLSDNAYYASWYPDGRHLAVVDFAENDRGVLKRVDLERHSAIPLTDSALVLAGMPSVSPEGGRVAFAGQANHGQAYDQSHNSIWLLGDNGKPQNVIRRQGRTPAWSPDGQWLAFGSNRGNKSDLYAIFVVRPDGSDLRQLTDFELDGNHPVWSRDGKALVVSARHTKDVPAATGIAVVQLHLP